MFTRVHDVEQIFGALNLFRYGMEDCCSGSSHSHNGRIRPETALPLTTIYDYGEALLFQAEIPGLTKDDLTIQLQGTHLEIKGEPKDVAPEGYKVHRQDRATSGFSRTYRLPVEIDGEQVTSSLENGILTLTLPKLEKTRKREIAIQ